MTPSPASNLLANEPSITRVAINHVHPLSDDTLVLLYELHGDLDRARELLGTHPDVLTCEITGEDEGVAYLHGKPTSEVAAIFEAITRSPLILETPLRHVNDGIQFTFVGGKQAIKTVNSAIPDNYDVTLERAGEYNPSHEYLAALLTQRQRKVLETAVKDGYYNLPRKTTQESIANEIGVTPETINEHLRKIESTVLSALCE